MNCFTMMYYILCIIKYYLKYIFNKLLLKQNRNKNKKIYQLLRFTIYSKNYKTYTKTSSLFYKYIYNLNISCCGTINLFIHSTLFIISFN